MFIPTTCHISIWSIAYLLSLWENCNFLWPSDAIWRQRTESTFDAWRHQAITEDSFYLTCGGSRAIHLITISQQSSRTWYASEITHLKLLTYIPVANKLINHCWMYSFLESVDIYTDNMLDSNGCIYFSSVVYFKFARNLSFTGWIWNGLDQTILSQFRSEYYVGASSLIIQAN